MQRAIATVLVTLMAAGCTTVPPRFIQDRALSENGGFVIEAEDAAGFQLEVFYRSYSFLPNPDDNIQDAKAFFVTVAQSEARKRGKAIRPVIVSALQSDATRNVIDGYYAIYVAGRVEYIP